MSPEIECLLERLRDEPGAISPYAASGAVGAAINEISRLRHIIRQMRGMAREGCEVPNAAYRWCERIDEVGFNGPMDEYEEYAWEGDA